MRGPGRGAVGTPLSSAFTISEHVVRCSPSGPALGSQEAPCISNTRQNSGGYKDRTCAATSPSWLIPTTPTPDTTTRPPRNGSTARDPAARQGRLARGGLAHGVRRARADPDGAVHLLRRGRPGGRTAAPDGAEHRRPDDHAVRHRGAEGVLPAQDPLRRDRLRDRLQRARRGDGPGGAQDQGRKGRRRGHRPLHRQRAEDLDDQRATPPTGSGSPVRTDPDAPTPQGHHHAPRADLRPRLLLHPHQHPRLARHHRQLLREHPRPRLAPGGRGEQGLAVDHQPAQPRTRHPRRTRHHGDPRPARRPALGHGRPSSADGHRVADLPWVRRRPSPRPTPDSTR